MLLLAAALMAQQAVQPASPPLLQEIIVTGEPLRDAEARLRDCLARHCPTDQDVNASLGLAEVQLIGGDYVGARRTLKDSLKRNHGAAARYPFAVSDLYRANGTVAAHLGIDDDYYRSVYAAYAALKYGTADTDYRRFMARIDIAEMLGKTRGHDWARNEYETIARDARKANRSDIAALAELRSFVRHYPEGPFRDEGIRKIAESMDPQLRAAVLEAKLVQARYAYEKKDEATAAELQGEFARMNIQKPILIFAPPFDLAQQEVPSGSFFDVHLADPGPSMAGSSGRGVPQSLSMAQWSEINRIPPKVDDMWIDVGFRITPEGKVADLRVLRSRGDRGWAEPLLESIRGRRYTPAAAGSQSAFRKERYTYTAPIEKLTGTKMVGRSPRARIEYFDLTNPTLTEVN